MYSFMHCASIDALRRSRQMKSAIVLVLTDNHNYVAMYASEMGTEPDPEQSGARVWLHLQLRWPSGIERLSLEL